MRGFTVVLETQVVVMLLILLILLNIAVVALPVALSKSLSKSLSKQLPSSSRHRKTHLTELHHIKPPSVRQACHGKTRPS